MSFLPHPWFWEQCLFPVGWGAHNEREREVWALALDVPPLPILYLASAGTLRLIVMPVNAESWLAGLFSGLALCCGVCTGTMCFCHVSRVHFLQRRHIIPMWKMAYSAHLTMVLKCTIDLRGFFTVFFSMNAGNFIDWFVHWAWVHTHIFSQFQVVHSTNNVPAAGPPTSANNTAISSSVWSFAHSLTSMLLEIHSSSDHIVAANHPLVFELLEARLNTTAALDSSPFRSGLCFQVRLEVDLSTRAPIPVEHSLLYLF